MYIVVTYGILRFFAKITAAAAAAAAGDRGRREA